MKKSFFISFDLGITGDYDALYAWLDDNSAIECGDSLAFLTISYTGDFLEFLKKELKTNLDLGKRNRFYIIWRDGEKLRGKFLFGKRKAAPWEGYGIEGESKVDELI